MKKSYGVDRPDKMSDSNDTILDIYKFSSDIVRCPTIILSLEVSYKHRAGSGAYVTEQLFYSSEKLSYITFPNEQFQISEGSRKSVLKTKF